VKLVKFTTFGKNLKILQYTKKLMGTNISVDKRLSLGEFYKIPKNWWIAMSVWMNTSAQK
jgi:hypothetical protein